MNTLYTHLHVNGYPPIPGRVPGRFPVSIGSSQRFEMLITISFLHVLVTRHVVVLHRA